MWENRRVQPNIPLHRGFFMRSLSDVESTSIPSLNGPPPRVTRLGRFGALTARVYLLVSVGDALCSPAAYLPMLSVRNSTPFDGDTAGAVSPSNGVLSAAGTTLTPPSRHSVFQSSAGGPQ